MNFCRHNTGRLKSVTLRYITFVSGHPGPFSLNALIKREDQTQICRLASDIDKGKIIIHGRYSPYLYRLNPQIKVESVSSSGRLDKVG